ncbi:hypothetical protein niasHT_021135 [Heterodera trifolii]|uniref:Uncharacterized protein n=1 Tax=Heterodera trifolii TaxID=157864 RepID=A0ABD2JF16_9BILA
MAIPASFPELSAFSNKPKSTECLCGEMEKGQNAPGGRRKTKVYFAVRTNCARPWERMFICGGNRLLGNWRPEKALEMAIEAGDGEENQSQQKTNSGRNQSSSIWRASIELGPEDSQRLLRFRFFLGFPLQTDPSNCQSSLSLLVVRWEAQMSPRCILPSVESNSMGECNKGVISEFGSYGGRDRLIMDGWLHGREQRQIFLRMFGTALRFFDPKLSERHFLIRVTPCDVRMDKEFDFANSISWRTPSIYVHSLDSLAEEEEHPQQNKAAPQSAHIPLPSHSFTEFANLLSDADPFFREQSEKGEPFRNDGEDYFVFRTTSVAIEFLAFRIELFMLQQRNWTSTESKIGLTPSRFALAYCMPSSMPDTIGSLSLPLVAVRTQKPMGQIKVDYLLATSVDWEEEEEEKHATRMETTFVKHWKKRRTLEVGHRGSGESFTKFATARENTIFSLNNAAQRGADFVEFDVQLSRDRSVVVFHDFHVLVSVATRNAQLLGHPSAEETKKATANPGSKSETNLSERTEAATDGGGELHKIAVRDLSLSQLRLLHVHHYKEAENISEIGQQQNRGHRLTGEADERDELRSFPTLVEALQRVDEHAGFNVEIKYPMKMRDGSHECENYFERNQYMDQLLVDVFRHAGKRRIVFSSFDPDICTLLSVKQNKYPVLFLCVGQTDRYVPFLDERSKVTRVGTNFAACSNLLGINLHSEELLSDPSSLKRAVAMKLITFVWGEDLDKLEHIAYFRRQNVDAIIYDRIGELEARQNVFVVEREVKSALFKSPRTSPSLSRANSLFHNSQSPTMPVEEPRRSPARRMLANGFARQMTIANTDFFPTK